MSDAKVRNIPRNVKPFRQKSSQRARESDPPCIVVAFDHGVPVPVKVSAADWPVVVAVRWHLDRNGYPRRLVYDKDGQRKAAIYLHRFVTRAACDVQVDHVYHDLLDCRRTQLRLASPSQNTANRRRPKRAKPSSSQFRGVTLHRQLGLWQAACHHFHKCHYLGVFKNEADAARAYDRKARELWGSFAITNFPDAESEVQAA